MTREEIDILWHRAMAQAVKDGELFTRYEFAKLVAEQERAAFRDHALALVQKALEDVQARENEACAQLCDIRETMFKGYKTEGVAALCAAAIRARRREA